MAQLIKKYIIKGRIKLLTGLHVGGTGSAMEIGGPDSLVIRNPIDNKPIIPGSSLKGKMRSLIEIQDGTLYVEEKTKERKGRKYIVKEYLPTRDPKTEAGNLFGTVGDNQQPSRLIVRDAKLLMEEKDFPNTDLPFTESKTEVVIDRITSAANPRQIERVPAGAEFQLEMVLNIFDTDNEKKLINTTKRALKLLEDDYIGGNGSRGYGQIVVEDFQMEERSKEFYLDTE